MHIWYASTRILGTSTTGSSEMDPSNESNTMIVTPGEKIGLVSEYLCGEGVFCSSDNVSLHAALTGAVVKTPGENGNVYLNVRMLDKRKPTSESVLRVGDYVLCVVTKVSANNTYVTILAVADNELRNQPKGIIRREDVRLSDIDSLVMRDCYRPGDIVKAIVLSLGGPRQYYLSTAPAECGVRWARAEQSGVFMNAVSWKV